MGIIPCIATKVCCALFMGEMRFVVGWAMVGRAEFAYLIAQMAAASNMMTEEVFAIVIWSLLWATVVAPFAFRKVLKNFVELNEKRRREEMGDDYVPEDDEDDGHGHDEEFRQSGHLPLMADMYPDFIPKKHYDGRSAGYTYINKGPQGSGFYKDFIPRSEKEEKEGYEWAEKGGQGPGLYILRELEQDGEMVKTYYRQEEVSTREVKVTSADKLDKPVTAHMEDNTKIKTVDYTEKDDVHDVHGPLRGKDTDEASEGQTERGSGFLCCLFFRKIVIM